MNAPNFHHLEIFHAVARLGSFSRASEELFLSQPSVSVQIRELERYYGSPLFHREGRRIRLTDIGQVVFDYTKQLFQTVNEMKRAVDNLKEIVTGRLLVGVSSTPGEYLLPKVLAQFVQFYPQVEVSLRIENTSEISRLVAEGNMDFGLVGSEVEDERLRCEPFYEDKLVVFAAPGNPLAQGKPIRLQDLANQPFVMREKGSATRKTAEEYLERKEVPLAVAMEVSSNEGVKRVVAEGLGLGFLSRLALEVDCAAGLLKILDIKDLDCRRHFYILYLKDRYLSRPQQAFLDLVTNLE